MNEIQDGGRSGLRRGRLDVAVWWEMESFVILTSFFLAMLLFTFCDYNIVDVASHGDNEVDLLIELHSKKIHSSFHHHHSNIAAQSKGYSMNEITLGGSLVQLIISNMSIQNFSGYFALNLLQRFQSERALRFGIQSATEF